MCSSFKDHLEVTKFRIAKMAQRLQNQKGGNDTSTVLLIKSLTAVPNEEDLDKYNFLPHPKEKPDKVQLDPNMDLKLILFDVKFLRASQVTFY